MSDVINKLIGVILAFILLAFAPLTINTLMADLAMQRSIMNEQVNLINKVSDSAVLNEMQLADFYLGVSSHGAVVDAKVMRFMRTVNPDGAGGTYTTYTPSDQINKWNKGDIIQVKVSAVDWTGPQKIMWQLLKLTTPRFESVLAGEIRE